MNTIDEQVMVVEKDSLCHYGVLGMKWGVRRYQNKDGSLTSAGRKHYGGDGNKLSLQVGSKSTREAKRVAAEKLKKQQALEKEKLTKAQQEKFKEEVISKGDYKKALNNMELFTNQELDAIITRHGKETALRDLNMKELKAERDAIRDQKNNKVEKFERVSKVIKTASDVAANMTNMYNSIAKASNAIFDSDLPVIGEKKEVKRGSQTEKDVRYEPISGDLGKDYVMKVTKIVTQNTDGTTSTQNYREMEKKKGKGNNNDKDDN